MHKQSVTRSLPASEVLFVGHAEQLPVPALALYVSAGHAEHAIPPDDAVYPALHKQSVTASLPAVELVLAGHGVQRLLPSQ